MKSFIKKQQQFYQAAEMVIVAVNAFIIHKDWQAQQIQNNISSLESIIRQRVRRCANRYSEDGTIVMKQKNKCGLPELPK